MDFVSLLVEADHSMLTDGYFAFPAHALLLFDRKG